MKLCVFVVVVFIGSALGDGDGGKSPDTGSRECPLAGEEGLDEKLLERRVRCMASNSNENIDIDNIDEARAFFKDYCANLSPVEQCMHEVVLDWIACHNGTHNRYFELISQFLETALEVSCSERGERLARVFQELQRHPESQQEFKGMMEFLKDCMAESNMMHQELDIPLSSRVFVAYKRMKTFKKCFHKKGEGVFTSTEGLESILSDILKKMKCIHPVSDEEVLCRTLNDEGTGDRDCPIEIYDEDEHKLRQKILDMGYQCLSMKKLDFQHLTNDSTQEEFRTFFNDYCAQLPTVRGCLTEAQLASKMCLNNHSHRIFQILLDLLETALETGCLQDGRRLATIFFEVQNHAAASSEQRDLVGECVDISVTKLKMLQNTNDEDPTLQSMRFYREVQNFEECFTNEIDIDTFKNVADSFLSDVIKKMECVDPLDGNKVLCRKIEIEAAD